MNCVSVATREHSTNKERNDKKGPQPQDLFHNSKTSCYKRQGNYFFAVKYCEGKKIKARLGQPEDPRQKMRTHSRFTHHFSTTSYQCCLPAASVAISSRLHKSEHFHKSRGRSPWVPQPHGMSLYLDWMSIP